MISCTCPNPDCKAELVVYENDSTPGCREVEEFFCPCCSKQAGSVFTSGMPDVDVVTPGKAN